MIEAKNALEISGGSFKFGYRLSYKFYTMYGKLIKI